MNTQPLIRSAMRDTALTVSSLSAGAQPESPTTWYEYCKNLVEKFQTNLSEQNYSAEEIAKLSYAQCALLDEIALKYLQGAARETWELEPLQVHFFQSYHAGDVLCNWIEELCQSNQPNVKIAEGYLSVINLGFRGRYVLDEAEADKWRHNLQKIVPSWSSIDLVESLDGYVFYLDQKGEPVKKGRRINPLWVLICCLLVAAATYFIFDYHLNELAEQIRTQT